MENANWGILDDLRAEVISKRYGQEEKSNNDIMIDEEDDDEDYGGSKDRA